MGYRELAAAAVILTLASGAFGGACGKKLIEYGWDRPPTSYVREHVADMEKIPFDGVVMTIPAPKNDTNQGLLGMRVFSKERLTEKQAQPAIDDLKATKFTRFTDNFVQLIAYPADVDWFDPDWSIIADNAGLIARIAKQGGCKGIMFDPEAYATPLWTYNNLPEESRKAHTFEEYQAEVRQRGREFMAAINKEYQDITMLCLYGPTGTTLYGRGQVDPDSFFGVLICFYQGMVEVAAPGTIIVDGYEWSYGYRERKQFEQGRKAVLVDARKRFDDPGKFDRHIRLGFGNWTDYDWQSIDWSTEDFTKNYFSPEALRFSLYHALDLSDRYVWIYTQKLKWWRELNAPSAYVEALALAKEGPGPGDPNPPPRPLPKASNQPGYSDEATFAETLKTMTEVFDFPKEGWKWARDESKTGQALGLHKPDFDDSSWRDISIGKFWEEQADAYDGVAWYRLKFRAPSIPPDKRVFLAFGAADESAWVWLNGHYVGKHDEGLNGWKTPFALDVTGVLVPGADNKVAVRVLDRVGCGGLWKSVKLMVK